MRRLVRVVFSILAVLTAIALGAAGTVYGVSEWRLSQTFDVPLRDVPVQHDSATVARGRHFATAIGKCADCHAADFGGSVMVDHPALGRITASNLTGGPNSVLMRYSDAEIARAIRHGVKKDGGPAVGMPSDDWTTLADDDVGAIIAYLRQLQPVERDLPPLMLRPLGRTLLALGKLPLIKAATIDHSVRAPATMPPDTSLAYGRYMADVGGCTSCHGPGLSGGRIPGAPPEFKPASNITPDGIGRWSAEELERVLRTGRRPDGSELDAFMPWRYTAMMSVVEMEALVKFVRSVPGKPYGGR